MKVICCLLLIIASFPVRSEAARGGAMHPPANPPGNSQSEPKDVRDIFLTLPRPKMADDDLFADVFGDSSDRKSLLARTDFTTDKSVLDVPNGYLQIDVFKAGSGSSADRHGYLVLTSFTMSNHDRLVVLQFTNLTDFPDTVIEDHFYLLSHGKYTEEKARTYLPEIRFFSDFWGEQPLPDNGVKEYVGRYEDAAFYTIVWPRRGTVPHAVSRIPYSDTDSKEVNRTERIAGKRQYTTIELLWDKDKGVFVKGSKNRHHWARRRTAA
jgi:hypothetical protein